MNEPEEANRELRTYAIATTSTARGKAVMRLSPLATPMQFTVLLFGQVTCIDFCLYFKTQIYEFSISPRGLSQFLTETSFSPLPMDFRSATYILQPQAGHPPDFPQPGFSDKHTLPASSAQSYEPIPVGQNLGASQPPPMSHSEVQTLQRRLDTALRTIREHEHTSALF
jgi:hypothetical protein